MRSGDTHADTHSLRARGTGASALCQLRGIYNTVAFGERRHQSGQVPGHIVVGLRRRRDVAHRQPHDGAGQHSGGLLAGRTQLWMDVDVGRCEFRVMIGTYSDSQNRPSRRIRGTRLRRNS